MSQETQEHRQWKELQKRKLFEQGYQVDVECPVNAFGNEKFDLVAKKAEEFLILEYERGGFTSQTFRNLYKGIHLNPTKIIIDCANKRTAELCQQYSRLLKPLVPETEIVVSYKGEDVISDVPYAVASKSASQPETESELPVAADSQHRYLRISYTNGSWVLSFKKRTLIGGKMKSVKEAGIASNDAMLILDKAALIEKFKDFKESIDLYFNDNDYWIQIFMLLLNKGKEGVVKDLSAKLNAYQFVRRHGTRDEAIDELDKQMKLNEFGKLIDEYFATHKKVQTVVAQRV